MTISHIGLIVVALLIPVAGFVLMIMHARKGDTRAEHRWRKRHGLLFWVLLPGLAGVVTAAGVLELLPQIFAIVGVALLGTTTFISWSLQTRHDERLERGG